MRSVVLMMGQDGKLEASSAAESADVWRAFLNDTREMKPGDTIAFAYAKPRSPKHHRLFFRRLAELLDAQEVFDTEKGLRTWLITGAGHYTSKVVDGHLVIDVQSVSFEELDEVFFTRLHHDIEYFLRQEETRYRLWPHLSSHVSLELVEGLLSRTAKESERPDARKERHRS